MPGIGEAIGFIFNLFGSKEERRRNAVDKLEKEKKYLLTKSATPAAVNRIQFIDSELGRLYKEAKNK